MRQGNRLFTSESVAMGHPDKLADQISDSVLDALLAQDAYSRVACETLVTTGVAIIAGEITTKATVDYPKIVREAIRKVGYTDSSMGIDADTCAVMVTLGTQSPDIAMGVNENSAAGKDIGAGDQGMMFGFACTETPELMPMPIQFSHNLVNKLAEARFAKTLPWLRPDAKSQVTIEYNGQTPVRVHTVVISTQHAPEVSNKEIHEAVREEIIKMVIPADLLDSKVIYHINPTGRFVVGGPHGDCGLTGRKIIVDTYGGRGRHGGGAFSGKDPTKVDRSACYMARYIAKNVVAAELADQCEVQLAYAIGVAEPVSVLVDTFGTGKLPDAQIADAVRKVFPLTPSGIIKCLDLRRPIYVKTASGGHFGREDFPWEQKNKVAELQNALAAKVA